MRNDIILQKMLRYTMKLVEYCSGYTYDTFISDIKLVEACVFNLSQLGELCRIVDPSFAQAHPQIPGGRCTVCATVLSTIMRVSIFSLSGKLSARTYQNCGTNWKN